MKQSSATKTTGPIADCRFLADKTVKNFLAVTPVKPGTGGRTECAATARFTGNYDY